jgi:hypothetical protein
VLKQPVNVRASLRTAREDLFDALVLVGALAAGFRCSDASIMGTADASRRRRE